MVSTVWGEEGNKRVEETAYAPVLRLTRPLTKRACSLRLVYGADRVCLGSTKAHTPSVQLTVETRGNTENNNKKQAEKQAG
jgi:hypothetical protein